MKVRIGSTWKNPQSVNVKVGGTWKQATDGFVKVGNTWKRVATSPLSINYLNTNMSPFQDGPIITPTVTGGNSELSKTYSITSGSLPAGVSLNASTGAITGPSSWNYEPQMISLTSLQRENITPGLNGAVFATVTIAANERGKFPTFGDKAFPSSSWTGNHSFFAKMNSSGYWEWVTTLTSQTQNFIPMKFAAAKDGGLFILGYADAGSGVTHTFGSSTISNNSGWQRSVLAKLSASGQWEWATMIAIDTGYPYDIAVDDQNSVYISIGHSRASITIGTDTYTGLTTTRNHFVIGKWSSSGVFQWSRSIAESTTNKFADVLRGTSDGIFIQGTYNTGSITLGSTTLTNIGSTDIFIAKLSSNGTWSWAIRAAATGADYVGTVQGGSWWIMNVPLAMLNDGSVLASGYFAGTITVGSLSVTASGTGGEAWLARVSSAGTVQWLIRAGSTNGQGAGGDAIISPKNSTLSNSPIVGISTGPTTPSIASSSITARSSTSAAVAKINENGTIAWVAQFGGTATSVRVDSVCQFSDGSAIVSGAYSNGTLVVGSTTLTATAGNFNPRMFVAVVNSSGSFTAAWSPAAKSSLYAETLPKSTNSAHIAVNIENYFPNSTEPAVFDTVTFPEGQLYNFGILSDYSTSGYIGKKTQPGFPATVTVSVQDANESKSTSITLKQGSSRVLGGTMFSDATYYYNVFTASSTFYLRDSALDVTILCVGGGGGGSYSFGGGYTQAGGGGGAGGVNVGSFTLQPGSYSVVIGSGGAGNYLEATNGGNSSFGANITATGGGRGGDFDSSNASGGGSGGGGGYNRPAGAGTAGQGNNGGAGNGNGAGGGGGAASAGTSATNTTTPGNGGTATSTYSSWASVTGTGYTNKYSAGGASGIQSGGGQSNTSVFYAGVDGWGTQYAISGIRASGGGGSVYSYSSGGSGVVIVRYLRSAVGG